MRLLLIVMLALLACNPESKKVSSKEEATSAKTTPVESLRDSLIIPDHLISPSRTDGQTYPVPPPDTVTARNNYVRYLISPDSCCSDNIYIQWGNDTVQRIEIVPSVRAFRSYFTPTLVNETKDYLMLWHGCATGCQALLFLPLNNHEKPRDISDFICYDPATATVVSVIDDEQQTDYEFAEAVNVKTGKRKAIRFNHRGVAAIRNQIIDSCRITDKSIYVRANLYDDKLQKDVVQELELTNNFKK